MTTDSKPITTIVFLGLIIAVVVLAFNSGKAPISINANVEPARDTITVAGEGEVEAMPDEAEIYVRIVNEGADAEAVQDENKEMTNSVISALKAKGVRSDEIETSRYSLNPRYNWDKGVREITGYEAQHVLKVTTNDLEEIGEFIDAAVAAGANSIQDIQFTLSESAEKKFNKEALEKASGNAKDKAEAIADSLDVKIVKLSRVSESSVGYAQYRYDYPMMAMAEDEAMAGGAPTPISPEKVMVRASVTLIYEMS